MPNSTCSIEGCDKTKPGEYLRKGLCQSHYDQARYRGSAKYAAAWKRRITRTCEVCAASFESKTHKAKYCSSYCRGRRSSVMTLTCFLCAEPMAKSRTSKPQGEAAHDKCRLKVHGKTGYDRGCRCETCRSGKAESLREWHALFRAEAGLAYSTVWKNKFVAENGYRPSLSGSDWISPRIRRELYERDGWTCYLCELEVDREGGPNGYRAPSLDHIIPKSKGGSDDPSNLKTCCRSCNSKKGVRLVPV